MEIFLCVYFLTEGSGTPIVYSERLKLFNQRLLSLCMPDIHQYKSLSSFHEPFT